MTDEEQAEAVIAGLMDKRETPGFSCECRRYHKPSIRLDVFHVCKCGREWKFKFNGGNPAWFCVGSR